MLYATNGYMHIPLNPVPHHKAMYRNEKSPRKHLETVCTENSISGMKQDEWETKRDK
jgi:hypothetical protein